MYLFCLSITNIGIWFLTIVFARPLDHPGTQKMFASVPYIAATFSHSFQKVVAKRNVYD